MAHSGFKSLLNNEAFTSGTIKDKLLLPLAGQEMEPKAGGHIS